MLRCFVKNTNVRTNKYILNINFIKLYKQNIYLFNGSTLREYSPFFRKFYFRSLLIYSNIMYSNLTPTIDCNYFYIYKYIVSNNFNMHFGFFFKKTQKI